MKCPKCNYISFNGLHSCKKCGYVFSMKTGVEIGNENDKLENTGQDSSEEDKQFNVQKTVASIRESLKEIEGQKDKESSGKLNDQSVEITTDKLRLRVDDNYLERSRQFPEHSDINWEESVPLSSDELNLGTPTDSGGRENRSDDSSEPEVPYVETTEFKEELKRIGEKLRQIECTTTESEGAPKGVQNDFSLSSARKGGFWIRLVAFLIDNFVLYLVAILLTVIGIMALDLGSAGLTSLDEEEMLSLVIPLYFFNLLITIMYYTYLHGSTGQTPGKMVCRLRVIRCDGRPLGYGRAFLRWLGYLVSSFIFCLGFFWIAWDRNKQGWHDKIADSCVIRV